ncbi:MAG: hydrogenase maturation nickel metallochaperone HypA [Candidatus Latescibacteria bacterium]|nr:hydrogenase maturation nickel metallochaperone HypA [Candidatus Latescibacterota bacterium]
MHEFGIVSDMVAQLLRQLQGRKIRQIHSLRFRRGSTFSPEALEQAYRMSTAGTLLEGAKLIIETVDHQFDCKCGHSQVVTCDELLGHFFICPQCSAAVEIDEAHDLELVEVTGVEEGLPPPRTG